MGLEAVFFLGALVLLTALIYGVLSKPSVGSRSRRGHA